MINCPRCHHENPEHAKACELCGSTLPSNTPEFELPDLEGFDLDFEPEDLEPQDFGQGADAPVAPQALPPEEDILELGDLDDAGVELGDFDPERELSEDVEEIEFEAQALLSGDEDHGPRGLGDVPAPSVDMGSPGGDAPSGLARLLHDALASSDPDPVVSGVGSIPPLSGSQRRGAPPFGAPPPADEDGGLGGFLRDALAEKNKPLGVQRPESPFDVSRRDAASSRNTLELPGADLLKQEASEVEVNLNREAPPQQTENAARAVGVQCGNCGGFNPEGMFYCVYCGFSLDAGPKETEEEEPVGEEVNCPSCSAPNPLGNHFCGSCGQKLDVELASNRANPAPISSGSLRTDANRKASPWDIRLISINEDGSDGLEILLDYTKTVVGRTGDTRFPTDAFLSPKHACLTVERGELFIEDLYSLNGTFVKLHDEVPLSPGDVFLMGRQVLRFEKFEQTITPKARSSDGTRYMGSPPPGGQFKLLQIGIGGVIQNVYCIPDSGAVLGREKGDIIFPRDKFMSGRHAQIYPREDGTYCLVDLNSSNGTWIKIWERTPLKNNDFIFMGQQLFRIEINGAIGS